MPTRKRASAVAYYRTSSATNVGVDKDSMKRQKDAVEAYAKRAGLDVVREFYDPAVSGADPIDQRPGFIELLTYLTSNGARTVLVENASRFARDLAVQIAGHDLLLERGIALIPVDAPDYFTDETPTAVMVRQILGAVSQFEKASLVQKLRKARDRKREETGRCEGRPPVPDHVKREARRLARRNPRTGKKRSLRKIAEELAALGHVGQSAKPYGPQSVKRMLAK
jgi:DNA invertase Pin-like site-specific DNA recombinase